MDKPKIAITDPSYLIRKALYWIVRELGDVEIVNESVSPGELAVFLAENQTPTHLIVNGHFASEICEMPAIKIRGVHYIKVSDTPYNNDDTIYIYGSKDEIHRKLLAFLTRPIGQVVDDSSELSDREKDVLKLVALGFINKDIAEQLYISTHTVISHRKNITSKLGIKTVSGLTVYAILNGIVPMDAIK